MKTHTRIYAENRIKEVRRAKGFTLEELGARMQSEPTATTVAKLENRRMALSLDYLVEIARVLEVPISELVPGGVEGVRMLPAIGQISAGNWQEAIEMSESFIPVPAHLSGANLFVLHPIGDSMDKVVQEGGYIVVDPDDCELRDRKYYVVMNGDSEATFKQFCADPLSLLPCSNNPDNAPIPLGSVPFKVIGRVVFAGQGL